MKVKALVFFGDLVEKCDRMPGDVFEVDKDRYEFLANHPQYGAMVELVDEKPKKTTKKKATRKKD